MFGEYNFVVVWFSWARKSDKTENKIRYDLNSQNHISNFSISFHLIPANLYLYVYVWCFLLLFFFFENCRNNVSDNFFIYHVLFSSPYLTIVPVQLKWGLLNSFLKHIFLTNAVKIWNVSNCKRWFI